MRPTKERRFNNGLLGSKVVFCVYARPGGGRGSERRSQHARALSSSDKEYQRRLRTSKGGARGEMQSTVNRR